MLFAIGERHKNAVGTVNDVRIRQDVAIFRNDEPRPDTTRHLALRTLTFALPLRRIALTPARWRKVGAKEPAEHFIRVRPRAHGRGTHGDVLGGTNIDN